MIGVFQTIEWLYFRFRRESALESLSMAVDWVVVVVLFATFFAVKRQIVKSASLNRNAFVFLLSLLYNLLRSVLAAALDLSRYYRDNWWK